MSKANILEIAKELLELEKKLAPQEPWKATVKRYHNCLETVTNTPIAAFDDSLHSEFTAQSRNHIRTLCEALVEAHAVLDLAAAQDIITPKVRPLSQYARAWRKKWGGEND